MVSRNYIAEVAKIVRDTLNLTIPIELDSLLIAIQDHFGVKCEVKNDLKANTKLYFKKDHEGNLKEIKIKYLGDRPETRTLFFIAHEIGHLCLHSIDNKKVIKDGEYERVLKSIKYELEANEFAAALLMPEQLFKAKCEENSKNGKVNVVDIANYFNVNVQAATIRGNVLGVWNS